MAVVVALSAIGCTDAGPPHVDVIEVVEFTPWATVGTAVPITIEARGSSGEPVAGVPVRASTSTDGGHVEPTEGVTDAAGQLFMLWTLSTSAGEESLRLIAGATERTLVASARAGPPVSLAVVEGDGQQGTVGDPLPTRIELESRDRHGNPSGGAEIDLSVVSGGGAIDPSHGVTDVGGGMAIEWTLGSELGPQEIEARLDGAVELRVGAEAKPGPAAALEPLSGDGQTGPVESVLPQPIIVRARDRFGHPSRSLVHFAVHGVGGRVTADSVVPDAEGLATTGWVLGPVAGTARVAVYVADGPIAQFSATVLPGPPEALLKTAGDDQVGPASGTLVHPLEARVVDAYGNGIPDLSVTFSVVDGGGSVNPESALTDEDGLVRTVFRLGPAIGSHRVAASFVGAGAGGGSGPVAFAATAASLPPARVTVVAGGGQTSQVGSAVTSAPAVLVSDAVGNPVPGVAVVFSPTRGSGSVSGGSPVTDGTGVAGVGAWVLGTTAGQHTLSASVPGVSPASIVATALSGPPSELRIAAGDGQAAPASSAVPTSPTVQVVDAFGNGVAGVDIAFAVTGGGGSIELGSARSTSTGHASAGRWTLGPSFGTNTLRASGPGLASVNFHARAASGAADYAMQIQFVGNVSGAQQAAVLSAADRWNSIVTGDVPDATVSLGAGSCGVGHAAYDGTVDDLVVFVEITTIDGPGGTLGSAGPCWLRGGSLLPIFGSVLLDQDDVAALEANGRLYDVAVHEIGHVLGIGTLWQANSLLQDPGGGDPHFSGAMATSEYLAGGGSHPTPVPVENTGGSGTRDAHWREANFSTEVMTGWINFGVSNSVSRVSIGSLADLGYSVNLGAADQFAARSPSQWPAKPPLRLSETPLGVPLVIH